MYKHTFYYFLGNKKYPEMYILQSTDFTASQEGFLCENGKCKKPCHCEEGWEVFGDHCYYFGTDKKSWTDAEQFCQEQFGHLASANTKAIQDYVVKGMEGRGLDYAWFGGSDREEEGVWKWTDYTPWEFTHWGPREPNNAEGGQDCLQYDGKWDDDRCTDNIPFVCSRNVCLE